MCDVIRAIQYNRYAYAYGVTIASDGTIYVANGLDFLRAYSYDLKHLEHQ